MYIQEVKVHASCTPTCLERYALLKDTSAVAGGCSGTLYWLTSSQSVQMRPQPGALEIEMTDVMMENW